FITFLFTHPASTELYPLSLHDALPICVFAHQRQYDLLQGLHQERWQYGQHDPCLYRFWCQQRLVSGLLSRQYRDQERQNSTSDRSEEHTSELQSRSDLVCRLLLEKKKK